MTLQLSTPIKIVALVGVALVLGVAGLATLALAHNAKTAATLAAPPTVHVFRAQPASTTVKHARPALHLDPSLPAPLHRALLRSRVIVAALWSPGVSHDAATLAAARTGAREAHVGFAALNVADEGIAAALRSYAPDAAASSVLVIRRPGKVVVELDGVTDAQTVTQAALAR